MRERLIRVGQRQERNGVTVTLVQLAITTVDCALTFNVRWDGGSAQELDVWPKHVVVRDERGRAYQAKRGTRPPAGQTPEVAWFWRSIECPMPDAQRLTVRIEAVAHVPPVESGRKPRPVVIPGPWEFEITLHQGPGGR